MSGKFCRDRLKNVVLHSVEKSPSLIRKWSWSNTASLPSFLYLISTLVHMGCILWNSRSGSCAIPLTPMGRASAVHHRGATVMGHHRVSATYQQSTMHFTGDRPRYAECSCKVFWCSLLKYWSAREKQIYNCPIFDIRYYWNVQPKLPNNSISSLYIWKYASCYCQVLSQIVDYGVPAYLSIQPDKP